MRKASPLRVSTYLQHILEAISHIEDFTSGVSELNFRADLKNQYAVMLNLAIIGEACHKIRLADPQFMETYPSFPLREVYGMRNKIMHGYFEVDLDVVWKAIQKNLPILKEQVQEILAKLSLR